ncbi:MAG TPA: hypothetical protein VJ848_07645 [Candidatus Angelobacter sp.]|nr:hypothetical protein [Candidatus Angelobacter sp.]
MFKFLPFILLLFSSPLLLRAQGTPPMPPDQEQQGQAELRGTPPVSELGTIDQVKTMVKHQIDGAIMGKYYPALDQWQPLTPAQKFHTFLAHTYSPRTFLNAGIDATKDKIQSDNREYERGTMGWGQHYGIELATSETDVFFERFLIPTVLEQDPRYFRNPELPFFRRALYSMSRVVITRDDSGHSTFNASKVLGGAASQALSDLYVPGQAQGLGPIRDRVTFDLLRDAGLNLLHEFWPDMRRKLFHR